ncbi:adenine phosphoribosyltransferase [Malassezia sp. CBS 17886]|nr:adenine phosphoribosyltransferase [Malassezia sp. CBS 17886]
MADIELLKSRFHFHADWPKPGILFCDILPVLRDPLTFEILLTNVMSHIFTTTLPRLAAEDDNARINYVVGLDARGFLLGPSIAQRLGAGFVPVRKRGKLPGACAAASFVKEYGEDLFEMQRDAIPAHANVLVVDDLIATGGSAKAAGDLVRQLNARTVEYIFVVSIPALGGAAKLDAPEYQCALVAMD